MAGGPVLELGKKGSTKRIVAVLLLALLSAGVACSGNDSGDAGAAGGGGGGDAAVEERAFDSDEDLAQGPPAAEDQLSSAGGGGGGAPATTGGTAARLPRIGPSVIKTATIDVALPDDELTDGINDAISIAGRYGGFVLSSQLGRANKGGVLTMRVPAERFEAALADLEGLGKVRSERIAGEDVGQEFVDLEARLRNWESQEAVLLKLMDEATSVTDTIRVQSELSRVQLEVEQIRGRLRFLRDQTAYGTITAAFVPASAPAPSTPGRFARAWERALNLMEGFVEGTIVATGVVIPLALIALILYAIFRQVRPRVGA